MEIIGVDVPLFYALLIGLVSIILYDWLKRMSWRAKYNIKGPVPLPIIGSLHKAVLMAQDVSDADAYKAYGPVYGSSIGGIKGIHVADVNILKKLMIKDHLKFQNRYSSHGLYPKPLDMSLLILQDAHWKQVRSLLTPSYSPGKIKRMVQEVKYASELLVSALTDKAKSGEPVDSKFQFGCYTMDVIAGTAFGIRTDAYKNPDEPFIALAKKVFGQDPFANPLLLLAILFPRLGRFLVKYTNISIFYPLDSLQFFTDLINDIIDDRNKKGDTSRNDLLQLMLNANTEGNDEEGTANRKLTKDEVLAQGFLVFIAGYETTASLLTYLSYALATHPDIQDLLTAEIDSMIKTDDDVTYDKIMEMPYLDQVVCETLRMYPPVTRIDRMTTEHQDVEVDGYMFPKDTMISYSIWQIHHQLGLYPEPEKFKPERFSPEEKQKRDPFTFIPFGQGPRNCIGMRLALLEAKMAVVQVMRKLKFVKVAETEEPLQLKVSSFLMAKNPVKVGVELRLTDDPGTLYT